MAIIYVSLISIMIDCLNHSNSHLIASKLWNNLPLSSGKSENLTEFNNAVQHFELVFIN